MAIITQIRNRVRLLVWVISLAIISFLLTDVFSGNGLFGNNGPEPLGKIDGEEVVFQTFDKKYQEYVQNQRMSTQQEKVDEQTLAALRDNAWNDIVKERIFSQQYKKLGIGVSKSELLDMIQGENTHPSIKQAFTNPETGEFDRNQVINFLKNLDQAEDAMKDNWLRFENYIFQDRQNTKYNTLIQKGIYTPTILAKQEYFDKENKASGRYLVLDYVSIPDSAANLTEADIKSYFNKNKAQFKQKEAIRKISYVIFQVTPTSDDSARSLNKLKDMIEDFSETTNDSLFVTLNSDAPFNEIFIKRSQNETMLEDSFFDQEVGSIYGPYLEGNVYKITKLLSKAMRADSVSARHILIKPDQIGIEAARNKADSLKNLIKTGTSFASLAETNSEDPGSASKGGDLGTFAEGMREKPFNDACFNGNKGDLVIVESQFGVHLIEILQNKKDKPAISIASITNSIESSSQTYNDVFSVANKFQGLNRTRKDFENSADTAGLTQRAADRILVSDRSVAGIPNSREIVRWAYKAKVNEVSTVLESELGFVVAVLKEAIEKGEPNFEQVKAEVEPKALKAKKAEMLKAKIANAKAKDLDGMASELSTFVQNFTDVSFASSFIPSLGRENKLSGAIFRAGLNNIAGPIEGERGVFVFEVTAINKVADPTEIADLKNTSSSSVIGRALNDLQTAMKTKMNVQDNRHLYY